MENIIIIIYKLKEYSRNILVKINKRLIFFMTLLIILTNFVKYNMLNKIH